MRAMTGQHGVPRMVIGASARADLALLAADVRLPWHLLGGSVADPYIDRIGVRVTAELVAALEGQGTLVLTDATHLPVGRLDGVRVSRSGDTRTATGRLSAMGVRPEDSWRRPAHRVVVAQRPFLAGEAPQLHRAALDPRPAVDGAECALRVLVPTGPTPDDVPADVLEETVRSSIDGLDAVHVAAVPLCWRDEASDTALLVALADELRGPVEVLSASDEAWRSALKGLETGQVGPELDATVGDRLLRWRPPPTRRGVVILLTGLSGSGKSSLASALTAHLRRHEGRTVTLLDGDLVRHLLSSGLGFDQDSRDLNVRRIGYVAAEVARHHGIAVCAPIAPYAASRAAVREMVEPLGDFVLVHVATPLAECERRDRKGLYTRARAGEIADFTGISSAYEVPTDADLAIDTTHRTVEDCVGLILAHLRRRGWLPS